MVRSGAACRIAITAAAVFGMSGILGCPPPGLDPGADPDLPGVSAPVAAPGERPDPAQPAPVQPTAATTLLSEVLFAPSEDQAAYVELRFGDDAGGLANLALLNEAGETLALPLSGSPAPGDLLLVRLDGAGTVDGATIHANRTDFLNVSAGSVRLATDGLLLDAVAWGEGQPDAVRLNPGGVEGPLAAGMAIGRRPGANAPSDPSAWVAMDPQLATPGGANLSPSVSVLTPAHGALLEVGENLLSWYPVAGATGYDVEIARDAALSDHLLREAVSEPAFTLTLEAGEYFWRVRARFGDAVVSEYSPVAQLEAVESFDAFFAAADDSKPVEARSKLAGLSRPVPLYPQRKDTYMMLLECDRETGEHAWNAPHGRSTERFTDPADNTNCALASISMINGYLASAGSEQAYLSQDRIGLEIHTVLNGALDGPEGDFNFGHGLVAGEITSGLSWALSGAAPTYRSIFMGQSPLDIIWTRLRSDVTAEFRAQFAADLQASIAADMPVLISILQPWTLGAHALVATRYAEARGEQWIGVNDPWTPRFSWQKLRDLRVAEYWLPPAGATPRKDESVYLSPPSKAADNDRDEDGVLDFDELLRFNIDANLADTDHDCISDYEEIRASVFNPKHGFGVHASAKARGQTSASDGKARKPAQPEKFIDSDGGGVPDFLEIGAIADLLTGDSPTDPYLASDDRLTIEGVLDQEYLSAPHFADGENHFLETLHVTFTASAPADGSAREYLSGTAHMRWTHEGYYIHEGEGPCRRVETSSPPQEWDSPAKIYLTCRSPGPDESEPSIALLMTANRFTGGPVPWTERCPGHYSQDIPDGGGITFLYADITAGAPIGGILKYISKSDWASGSFSYDVTEPNGAGGNDTGYRRTALSLTFTR